ncbi:hypothetical protein EC988_007666, partial [Linderina pennispora]
HGGHEHRGAPGPGSAEPGRAHLRQTPWRPGIAWAAACIRPAPEHGAGRGRGDHHNCRGQRRVGGIDSTDRQPQGAHAVRPRRRRHSGVAALALL